MCDNGWQRAPGVRTAVDNTLISKIPWSSLPGRLRRYFPLWRERVERLLRISYSLTNLREISWRL